MWMLDVSQPYGPPRHVTGLTLRYHLVYRKNVYAQNLTLTYFCITSYLTDGIYKLQTEAFQSVHA
jgi:hypothetical protein